VQANVRVLNDGETVSIDGTHLGHNIPDVPGVNRYCIDLVSVAGKPSVNATACPYGLAVYFGNGCFWHTQYDFYNVETDPNGPFNRSYKDATARTGYAGGKGEGANGQVCYVHGPPPSNPKSPEGTVYEEMAYAEAVQVMLDTDNEYAQFEEMIKVYFEDTFKKIELNDGKILMQRGDAGDQGQAYRNVIGIPGGVSGPFYDLVVKHNIYNMELIEGGLKGGPAGDTVDEYVVYIYCSILRPFYRAEQFHMFHPNVVLNRDIPYEYQYDAQRAALERGWIDQTCSEADAAAATNKEVLSEECSAVCLATGMFLNGLPQTGCKAATEATAALPPTLPPSTAAEPGSSNVKSKHGGGAAAAVVVVLLLGAAAGGFVYVRKTRTARALRTYDISVQDNDWDEGDDEDALVGAGDG